MEEGGGGGVGSWGGECFIKSGIIQGDMGDFCPNLTQTFLESINRGGRNYGVWEVIPVFHDLRPKGQRE